jgi:hypothetical protein
MARILLFRHDMNKSKAARGLQMARRALALVGMAVATTAGAQMAMPALTYDVVVTSFSADGDSVVTRETHAMRRDGSTVTVLPQQAADGTTYELRRIQDLAHGRSSQIDTGVRTVISLPLKQNAVDRFLNGPGRSCGAPMDATRVTFGAYYGLRFSTSADSKPNEDGGRMETERLVAPQLGCVSLLTVYREDGKVTGIRQIENVRPGEPDPGLFVVPADYREASPAEVSPSRQRAVD